MFEICKKKEEKMIEILDIKDAEPNKSNWIPISDMPNCCGYPGYLQLRINLDKEVSARLSRII